MFVKSAHFKEKTKNKQTKKAKQKEDSETAYCIRTHAPLHPLPLYATVRFWTDSTPPPPLPYLRTYFTDGPYRQFPFFKHGY